MYQRAQRQPGRIDRATNMEFSSLTTEERLQKIARQEVMGARMQASKAVSHLEDRGMLETMSYAETDGGRKFRASFRITDLGRDRLKRDEEGDSPKAKKDRSEASRRAYQTRRARHGEEGVAEQIARAKQTREARHDSKEIARRSAETRRKRGLSSEAGKKAVATRKARGEDLAETTRRAYQKRVEQEGKEEISRKARESALHLTAEQKSEASRRGWETRRRNGTISPGSSNRTPEERTAAARKGWETQRMRAALRTRQNGTKTTTELFEQIEAAKRSIEEDTH